MKKNLLVLLFTFVCLSSLNAQLPYSKILGLDESQLKEGHFKYDKNKNQYVLKKSNGLNNTLNVLNAVNGQTADMRPHEDDYVIVRQEGETGVSELMVRFYKDGTFHEIETWLAENNIDVIETNSGKITKQKFNYDNYNIELTIERVGISATTGRTSSLAKSIDQSYNVYTYIINTGIPPYSKWHAKQNEKKAKNEAKNKKKNIDDLM